MKAVRVELVVMTVRDQALDVLLVRYPGNEWALPGGSATPATTRATGARVRPASNCAATPTGSAYTQERRR